MHKLMSYNKWLKNIALSFLLYIFLSCIFIIDQIIEGSFSWSNFGFTFLNRYLPYMYILISVVIFCLLLFLFENRKNNNWKFYVLFHSCWVLLTFVFSAVLFTYFEIVYSDGYDKGLIETSHIIKRGVENFFNFFILGFLNILFAIPYNIMIFLYSYYLIKLYNNVY